MCPDTCYFYFFRFSTCVPRFVRWCTERLVLSAPVLGHGTHGTRHGRITVFIIACSKWPIIVCYRKIWFSAPFLGDVFFRPIKFSNVFTSSNAVFFSVYSFQKDITSWSIYGLNRLVFSVLVVYDAYFKRIIHWEGGKAFRSNCLPLTGETRREESDLSVNAFYSNFVPEPYTFLARKREEQYSSLHVAFSIYCLTVLTTD